MLKLLNQLMDYMPKVRKYFSSFSKMAAGSKIKEGMIFNLIPDLYLKQYTCIIIGNAFFSVIILDILLFLFNRLFTLDYFLLGVIFEMSLLLISCIITRSIFVFIFQTDIIKLIIPMNLSNQEKALQKKSFSLQMIIILVHILSMIFFMIEFIIQYFYVFIFDNIVGTYNASIENVVDSLRISLFETMRNPEFWVCAFCLFIMLLCIICLCSWVILLPNKQDYLMRFIFNSNRFYGSGVSVNNIELYYQGSSIKKIDLSQEKFFIESDGVLLIYNVSNEEFCTFLSSKQFDLIIIKSNDGTMRNTLCYNNNNKWEIS